MEHPDWPAFIAAIVANPDDDTARLVAADFLEENGDADRAAFIRIQIALARLEADGLGKSLDADELRAKERAFLSPLAVEWMFWAANECPELVSLPPRGGGRGPLEGTRFEGAESVAFRRGFIEVVRCDFRDWAQYGAAIRRRNPIRRLVLTACEAATGDDFYAMMPALTGLAEIEADDSAIIAWLRARFPYTLIT